MKNISIFGCDALRRSAEHQLGVFLSGVRNLPSWCSALRGRGLRIFISLLAIASATVLAGCSKPAAETPAAAAPEKAEAKAGVTMDAETQERVGLKIESPTATQWQPELRAAGRVADPLVFTAAAADYETARAATLASQSELERTQKLAAQDNASPRVLETAQATAARDALALKSARAKFTAEWGVRLAAQTNLTAFAEKLQTDDTALVKIFLPVGVFPNPLPTSATIFIFNRETNSVAADFADDLGIDPMTQVQTLLFAVSKKLPPSISVTAALKISGEPVSGVTVPADAVVRHEGKGWVYVQTATNQFERVEVPLDKLTGDGWFVAEDLSATNRIVTSGGQTVLSTEVSAHAAP